MRAVLRPAVLATALSVAASVSLGILTPTPARAVNATVSGNTLRTGWDQAEPALSPASVSSSDFGQVFDATIPTPAGATAN